MGASCDLFDVSMEMYTGNLPREMSVTLTKCSFPWWKGYLIYHGKSAPRNSTYSLYFDMAYCVRVIITKLISVLRPSVVEAVLFL